MCTYNGARFIREQLYSIIAQTRLPDELVICDDKSTDQTLDIIRAFDKKAPFAVCIHSNKEQLGTSANFEKAISLCTGDIIFLADQDDIWISEKISIIENIFLKHPDIGVVFSNAGIIDENSKPLDYTLWQSIHFNSKLQSQIIKGNAINVLLNKNVITGATMAFRSKYKQTIFPIPNDWIHDHWISLFVGIQSNISPINQPLIKYRIHSSQQIGLTRKSTLEVFKLRRKASELINQDMVRYSKALDHLATTFPESISRIYKPFFENKISHLKFRRDLSRNNLKGVLIITKKLLAGEYRRYSSRSSSSALYDIYRLMMS